MRKFYSEPAKDSPNGGFSKRFIRHMILASNIVLLSALKAIFRAISLSVVPAPQLCESSRYGRGNHWYMRALCCSQILYAKCDVVLDLVLDGVQSWLSAHPGGLMKKRTRFAF
jgi:hypothetical protein